MQPDFRENTHIKTPEQRRAIEHISLTDIEAGKNHTKTVPVSKILNNEILIINNILTSQLYYLLYYFLFFFLLSPVYSPLVPCCYFGARFLTTDFSNHIIYVCIYISCVCVLFSPPSIRHTMRCLCK